MPEKKGQYGRHRSRWDIIIIIKIDLKAIRLEEAEWVTLARNTYKWVPVVTTVMNTHVS